MKLSSLQELFQKLIGLIKKPSQSPTPLSQNLHYEHAELNEDGLVPISALSPDAFHSVYPHGQLPSSTDSMGNEALDKNNSILNDGLKKALKESIGRGSLSSVKRIFGPEVDDMDLVSQTVDNFKQWVQGCCRLLLVYAIEDVLLLAAEKHPESRQLIGEDFEAFQENLCQQLKKCFIDKAPSVIQAFGAHVADYIKADLIVYLKTLTNAQIEKWVSCTSCDWDYELHTLKRRHNDAERSIKTAHSNQVKLNARSNIDLEDVWSYFTMNFYGTRAFPDPKKREVALEGMQQLKANGIASRPIGTALVINDPDLELSILDYALLMSERAEPSRQGFFFVLIDYLVKRGALFSFFESNSAALADSSSAQTLRENLLKDPIKTVFAWQPLQKIGLLGYLRKTHMDALFTGNPNNLINEVTIGLRNYFSGKNIYIDLRALSYFVKKEKLSVRHINLRLWFTFNVSFRYIQPVLDAMGELPVLETLDARGMGLNGTDLLDVCQWMDKSNGDFTIVMGEETLSDDKQLTVPETLTVTLAVAKLIRLANKRDFLSRQFLEQLDSYRNIPKAAETLLCAFTQLAEKGFDISWLIETMMRNRKEVLSLATIIDAASHRKLLSTQLLAHLQHTIAPETYPVLAYICQQNPEITGDELKFLCRYSFAVKYLSRKLGYQLEVPFTPEELVAERDTVDWRARLEHDFNLNPVALEPFEEYKSFEWMAFYFQCVGATHKQLNTDFGKEFLENLTATGDNNKKALLDSIQKPLMGCSIKYFMDVVVPQLKNCENPYQENLLDEPFPIRVDFAENKDSDKSLQWIIDTLQIQGNLTVDQFSRLMPQVEKSRRLHIDGAVGHSRQMGISRGSRVDKLVESLNQSSQLRDVTLSRSGFNKKEFFALINVMNNHQTRLSINVSHYHPNDKGVITLLYDTQAHRHARAWLLGETLPLDQCPSKVRAFQSFLDISPGTSLPEAVVGFVDTLRHVIASFGPMSDDCEWYKAIEYKIKRHEPLSKMELYCKRAKKLGAQVDAVWSDLQHLLDSDDCDPDSENYSAVFQGWRQLMKALTEFSFGVVENDLTEKESIKLEAFPSARLITLLRHGLFLETAWTLVDNNKDEKRETDYRDMMVFLRPLEDAYVAMKLASSNDIQDENVIIERNKIYIGWSMFYDFTMAALSGIPALGSAVKCIEWVEKTHMMEKVPHLIEFAEEIPGVEYLIEKGKHAAKKLGGKILNPRMFRSSSDQLRIARITFNDSTFNDGMEQLFHTFCSAYRRQLSPDVCSVKDRYFLFEKAALHVADQLKEGVFTEPQPDQDKGKASNTVMDKEEVISSFVRKAMLQIIYFIEGPSKGGLQSLQQASNKLEHFLQAPELICLKMQDDQESIHRFRFDTVKLLRPNGKEETITIDTEGSGTRHAMPEEVVLFNEKLSNPVSDLTFETTVIFAQNATIGGETYPDGVATITFSWKAQSQEEVDDLRKYQFKAIPCDWKSDSQRLKAAEEKLVAHNRVLIEHEKIMLCLCALALHKPLDKPNLTTTDQASIEQLRMLDIRKLLLSMLQENNVHEPGALKANSLKSIDQKEFKPEVVENKVVTPDDYIPKGLKIKTMPRDGDCLFHAVAYLLWGKKDKAKAIKLRHQVADFLDNDKYEDIYVGVEVGNDPNSTETYRSHEEYIAAIRGGTKWAGQHEIMALQEIYRVPIVIIRQKCRPQFNINWERYPDSPIFIHHDGINHYEALSVQADFNSIGILKGIERQIQLANEQEESAQNQQQLSSQQVVDSDAVMRENQELRKELGSVRKENSFLQAELEKYSKNQDINHDIHQGEIESQQRRKNNNAEHVGVFNNISPDIEVGPSRGLVNQPAFFNERRPQQNQAQGKSCNHPKDDNKVHKPQIKRGAT